MSVHSVYRLGIWLPLVLPALIAGLVNGLGVRVEAGPLQKIAQVLLMSLVYGGVPYAALAIWATLWVGGRPEAQIRRLMLWAPLLMAGVFVPVAVLAGISVGEPAPFIALAVLGAIVTVPLGYLYVGLVVLLRRHMGPRAPFATSVTGV